MRKLQMTNELQSVNTPLAIFNECGFDEIRKVEIDGNPWFVLKDVCSYFGEKNYRRKAAELDERDKGTVPIQTKGGKQNMVVVNESGLYDLLFQMQPEKAPGVTPEYIADRRRKLDKFRRWVTHEVLPSVRKNGMYIQGQELLDCDALIDAALKYAERISEYQSNNM